MNNIGLVVYGRFPTEKAYGSHLIDTANGFIANGKNVTIFYSKTSNSKTIDEQPSSYYQNSNINYIEVENFDFTKFYLYQVLPNVIQKFLWSLGAYLWSRKLVKHIDEIDILWTTNPNLFLRFKKLDKKLIYEKHGAGKYLQKIVIRQLSKFDNTYFVGTSKTSYFELKSLLENRSIYLTNGVNTSEFKQEAVKSPKLNIGYVGMLETYGVDKGVKKAFDELKSIATEYNCKLTLVGGPAEKLNEIIEEFYDSDIETHFEDKVPKKRVPEIMSQLDIGIVPYPDEFHMANYASPIKIFEYAASNTVVLASDIKSNYELNDLNLGIHYFKSDDFKDFGKKIIELIENTALREELLQKSKNNIEEFSIQNRVEKLLNFCS